jgi:hypothetical protein
MKSLFFTGLILLFSLSSFAQYAREDGKDSTKIPASSQKKPIPRNPILDHISIGGSCSLELGSLTYIAVAPLLGYRVSDEIMIAAGPMYQYFSISDNTGTYANNIYGGRADAYVFLPGRLRNFFIQGEYEVLNVPDDYSVFANITRAVVAIPLAGAGIRRPLGEKSYYTLSGLWDFSHSPLSPYYFDRFVVTAGVDFGI